jgi:hypothetical protein
MAFSNISIRIEIEIPTGEKYHLRYVIAEEQAEEMFIGPRPPEIDSWAVMNWASQRDRAISWAKAIASDLGWKIIQAINKQ